MSGRGWCRLAGLGLLAVSACTNLPRSGPYRSDLLASPGGAARPFSVVELTPTAADALARARKPGLAASFGAYRPSRQQRIGIGDSLQITIWEAGPGGLFSAPVVDRESAGSRSASIPEQVVARDRSITVPFAGRILVAGRTPPEVETMIVARLRGKAIDPQALVTVTRNNSNTVTVLGEVGAARRVALNIGGERLLDVVAEAGGARAPAYDTQVVLARDNRVIRVPLQTVLDDPKEDVYLQGADIVTLVPDPQTFTAAGATGRNAVVPFQSAHLSLDEAIARAGGVLDDRGDPDGVFVIRFESAAAVRALRGLVPAAADGTPVVYHLNLRTAESLFTARRFAMRNKDILYVSDAPLTDIQKVLSLVNLLVTPAVTGTAVNSNLR
jgi:polysaccharide export outer membrane protein